MSLKGVCSIELRDSDGNIVQKTEDENMVTNYLANLVNPNLDVLKSIFNKGGSMDFQEAVFPIIDKVIGGVLLFGDSVEENADYTIPYASLIGNASSTYTYNISTRGVFNQNESIALTDTNNKTVGYRYVWDFSTDKANGTIKCIALTTGKMGDKGYQSANGSIYNCMFISLYKRFGYNSNYYTLNVFDTRTREYLYSSYGYGSDHVYFSGDKKEHYDRTQASDNNYYILGNFERGDYIYAIKMTARSITLAHYAICKTIGLADSRRKSYDYCMKMSEKTISFDKDVFYVSGTTTNSAKMIKGKVYTDNKYIYVTGVKTNNIYLYKIDHVSFEIIESISETIDIPGVVVGTDGDNRQGCALFEGHYYIVQLWDSKDGTGYPRRLRILSVNSSNLTEYESIAEMSSHSIYESTFDPVVFSIYDNSLFISGKNKSIMIRKNKVIQTFEGGIPATFIDLKFPYCFVKEANDSAYNYNYGCGVCTHGLITIDNLSTPIIKNSTQTMKITYEITEVDETL